MTFGFAISPDVHVRDITDWFVLNTRLQRLTGQPIRATVYDDFGDLHRAYDDGRVDLVYANAADTALLVRDHGFLPVAAPQEVSDEAVVVVAQDGPLRSLDDLGAHLTVAATDAPDVERICRILLEPADLTSALLAAEDQARFREIGIDWMTRLCDDLLAAGVPGLQFFTLNRSKATAEILARLRRIDPHRG